MSKHCHTSNTLLNGNLGLIDILTNMPLHVLSFMVYTPVNNVFR